MNKNIMIERIELIKKYKNLYSLKIVLIKNEYTDICKQYLTGFNYTEVGDGLVNYNSIIIAPKLHENKFSSFCEKDNSFKINLLADWTELDLQNCESLRIN